MSFETPRADRKLGLALGALYVALLYVSADSLGYARDEGFYFQSARAYRGWFDLLWSDPASALSRAGVDRFWVVNHEHPSLMKVLFAFSHQLFYERLGWIREAGTAYRLPGMVLSGLGVALIHHWGSRISGRAAGFVGALLFACMPRVFYHAHLACFDLPVASVWLFVAYLYARSLETSSRGYVWATGLCYGLLLDTKHNSWLFPAFLVMHVLALNLGDLLADRKRTRPLVPPALIAIALLGPPVFVLLWPWLWFDTWHRFLGYVQFHLQHEYYNMEFLGQTYWKPPMPMGYAWLMTLATLPATTLGLALIGGVGWLRGERSTTLSPSGAAAPGHLAANPAATTAAHELLWLFGILVGFAPWWSQNTPIFGGTKHWLTAYPFLALFAGQGFRVVAIRLRAIALEFGLTRLPVVSLTATLLSAGAVVMTVHSHPYGLSFYTPLVGGAPGAATLGLNRTFWGYTTGSLAGFINENAAPGASVFVHDTALQSWDMMRADGRIRSDLEGTLSIADSSMALYHHEPHMGRVEYQIWVAYDTQTPAEIACYDGVPVAWVYQRK